MKLDLNKEMSNWLVVLNNNAKWAVAITIRFLTLFMLMILFVLFLKWTGIISELKNIGTTRSSTINSKDIVHESKPSTPTHTSDIKNISDLQKLINNKIKNRRKEVM